MRTPSPSPRLRLLLLVGAALAGCREPRTTAHGAPAVVALRPTRVTEPPRRGREGARTAALLLVGERVVAIDEDGLAFRSRHGVGSPLFPAALPFAEPVVDVLHVRTLSRPSSPPWPGPLLPPSGDLLCARTRARRFECITEWNVTEMDGSPRRVDAFRYTFPAIADVTHLGLLPQGPGMGPAACVRFDGGRQSRCFTFTYDGSEGGAVLEGETAEQLATGLPKATLVAWRRAGVDPLRAKKVVATNDVDTERASGDRTNASVRCALAEDGTVSCFGGAAFGLLGDGRLDGAVPRATRPLGDLEVRDLAAGDRHVCAALATGMVACWGAVLPHILQAKGTKRVAIPPCAVDEQAAERLYAERHAREVAMASECVRSCDENPVRDCRLNCGPHCVKPEYVFRHPASGPCREPSPSSLERFQTCSQDARPPWATERQLHDTLGDLEVVPRPAEVVGLSGATSVVTWGPRVCVVSAGRIVCAGS